MGSQKSHTVIVMLEAKPGQEEILQQALEAVIVPSRLEASNIIYKLHQHIEHPNKFIFYEIWQSEQEHAKQFEKPYIKSLIEQLDALLAAPIEVIPCVEI